MDITTHMPGSFCTAVLRSRDPERAAAFYRALVGWTTQEVSGTPGHRLLQSGGRTVASLHHIADGSDLWVPHVSVESVERTAADVLTLGGTLVDTTNLPGFARLATVRDPEGALFGLYSIFEVEDCDATIERAQRLGGSTIFVHTVPTHGRVGSVSDSGGASFAVRGPVPERALHH